MLCMIAARHRCGVPNEDPKNLTVYASSQAHSSVAKGAKLIGLPEENVRLVPVDGGLRMRPDALREMIEHDRTTGLKPIFVCVTVGTTSTGAVDTTRAGGASTTTRGPTATLGREARPRKEGSRHET